MIKGRWRKINYVSEGIKYHFFEVGADPGRDMTKSLCGLVELAHSSPRPDGVAGLPKDYCNQCHYWIGKLDVCESCGRRDEVPLPGVWIDWGTGKCHYVVQLPGQKRWALCGKEVGPGRMIYLEQPVDHPDNCKTCQHAIRVAGKGVYEVGPGKYAVAYKEVSE